MRSTLALLAATAVIAAAIFTGVFNTPADAATGPIPLNCNRACLEGLINQYLDALAKRDPSGLPLSTDLRYSENFSLMDIGDGFWKTVEGRGRYSHIFADPEAAQVAFMGTMLEAGGPVLMSTRLRIELGRITEIENMFFKPGGGGPNNIAFMDTYTPEPFWFRSIPPAQRLTRQQLISVADAYFTGLTKNDGKGIGATGTYAFTPDCRRLENGQYTAGAERQANSPEFYPNGMDCLAQFKLGYYFVVQNIHSRRYPVVDIERGIVLAYCTFDQGTVNKGVLSTGKQFEFKGFNRPSSIMVSEAFLIEPTPGGPFPGGIRRVEMVGTTAPYHLAAPWPGGLSGN